MNTWSAWVLAAVVGIMGLAPVGQAQNVAPSSDVAAPENGSPEQEEEETPEAAEEEAQGAEPEAKTEEEAETEEMERQECSMQLMPFRAQDESGMALDSAILVDGCTGESMMLRRGVWKNSQTGEDETTYYWVRIPRANPRLYEDEAAPE